jgi:sugar phosphate isomerase/epimerase
MSTIRSSGVLSRREFGTLALAAVPLSIRAAQRPTRIDSTIAGVRIGVQSFSFRRMRGPDEIIKAMTAIGLGSVELMSNHAEAGAGAPADPAERGRWRRSPPPDAFKAVRASFEQAGIEVAFLCYNFAKNAPDEEIEYAFQMARGLGAAAITTSTQVSMAKRIAPFADKHRMRVGFHNHHHAEGNDPDEIATPANFDACMAASKYHGVNLDVGHFTAANFDAVDYIAKHHARITNVHLKDRKKDHGPIVPWGTGDAPLARVLELMRDRKLPFPANIEYEYPGGDPIAEVRKCFDFCRSALAR